MSLLREIQTLATDGNTSLPTLLRKCKILAVRLHHEPFKEWVDKELNGYETNTDEELKKIPPYRVLKSVQCRGHFSGPFGSGLKNGVIASGHIPAEWRDALMKQYLHQGISAFEELAKGGMKKDLQVPWPSDLIFLANDVYEGMGCLSAWKVIPPTSVIELLDTVRNKILDFALEIESKAPDAGEASPSQKPVDQTEINRIFQTIVMGDVGTLVAGSSDFSVQTLNVKQGDILSLESHLRTLGFELSDIADLKKAIANDGKPQTSKELGTGVSSWLGRMVTKAASGTIKIGTSVAADVLTKAITHYYFGA